VFGGKLLLLPEERLSIISFFVGIVKIKIDQLQQSPFNLRPDVSKDEVVGVFAVLYENVPGSSDYFPPLGLARTVLELFHDLLKQADVEHSHLIGVFRNYVL
jgi:hypothetical protein